MDKIALFLLLLIINTSCAQNVTTVNYTPNLGAISNPERGFYRHSETKSIKYTPLIQNELVNYRTKDLNTLLLRVFYLEKFMNSPLDQNYLNAMTADFATIRNAGLKCIVRFAYSKKTKGVIDATKAQMLRHIAQLKPVFEANNDVVCLVQAGFIGAWGEWYYTSNFGLIPNATDYANRKEITDALLVAIPQNRMLQLRTPSFKQKLYDPNPIAEQQAYTGTILSRIGHFNDCFLSDATDNGTYSDVATQYPYLESETKYLAMGGETCDPDNVRANCSTALTEMEKFHWSYMNMDYNADVIAKFKDNKCFDEISNKLGYRFELIEGSFPDQVAVADKLHLDLSLKNVGFATPYNKKEVALVLRNTVTKIEYPIALDADPRFWEKNENIELSYDLTIPTTITSGNYELFLHIGDADDRLKNRPEYAIQLANTGTWESSTGYNDLLHAIKIVGADIANISKNEKMTIVITPVPANDNLTIEIPEITTYEITIYNNIGKKIAVEKITEGPNKIALSTKNLESGVYLIEFKNENHKEYRKIIIKH